MQKFNILTPGEKIKYIRKTLKLRQEDIAGDTITRNLISIIENNKANLTENVAKILTNNINNICKKKKIKFSVTEDYLLENTLTQAKKITDAYINHIDNLSINEIDKLYDIITEINLFLKSFDVKDDKASLYIEIARKFKLNKQYAQAIKYYLKAFESAHSDKRSNHALYMLGICNIYLANYTEAIYLFTRLLRIDTKKTYYFDAKYNISLCYKKLCDYNETLSILTELNNEFSDLKISDPNSYIDMNLLIGVCLNQIGCYNKAIDKYNDLLKFVDEDFKRHQLVILINLSEVYMNISDLKNLKSTCGLITSKLIYISDCLQEYESEIYIALAKNFKFLNDHTTARHLLSKTLKSLDNGNSLIYLENLEDLFTLTLELYSEIDDTNTINFIRNQLVSFIDKAFLPKRNKASIKFLQYYNTKSDRTEFNEFLNFLLE